MRHSFRKKVQLNNTGVAWSTAAYRKLVLQATPVLLR
jgi:hypothetical protein